jgi:hypothetical protein
MRGLWEAADFVRKVRTRLRFGEMSRAPLTLLRLEVSNSEVECDWIMRPPDAWDEDLPRSIREANISHQTLRDALRIREMLFAAFDDVCSAKLRVFRYTQSDETELIMTGTVLRDDEVPTRIQSLAMRAQLCGFRFSMPDGVLLSKAS